MNGISYPILPKVVSSISASGTWGKTSLLKYSSISSFNGIVSESLRLVSGSNITLLFLHTTASSSLIPILLHIDFNNEPFIKSILSTLNWFFKSFKNSSLSK